MIPDSLWAGPMLLAAGVGLLAAFWSKLKAIAWRIANLVVVRIELDGEAANAAAAYLWRCAQRSRYGERTYHGDHVFVRSAERQLVVAYEVLGRDPAVFWVDRKPLLVYFSGESVGSTYLGTKLKILFLRGMFAPDAFVKLTVDALNERRHGGGFVRYEVTRLLGRGNMAATQNRGITYDDKPPSGAPSGGSRLEHRYIGYTAEDIGQPRALDPTSVFVFPPQIHEVIEEARRWKASERWYKERQVPWRRGYLFWGAPGVGKSSLARTIAQDLDLPVFQLELATFSDSDLVSIWHKIMASTPCLILIEDIDTVFQGRTNCLGDQGGGLNFGTLLNCLSGVEGSDGILLVITTNRWEYVDEAIGAPAMDHTDSVSTRPGRIDRAVKFEAMDADCRLQLAQRILSGCPHEIERLVTEGEGLTPAQFVEICAAVALKYHWKIKEVLS